MEVAGGGKQEPVGREHVASQLGSLGPHLPRGMHPCLNPCHARSSLFFWLLQPVIRQ